VKRYLPSGEEKPMQLGAFSVSLSERDLEASRSFSGKPGFRAFAGNPGGNPILVSQHVQAATSGVR
jgi:hypothetical protein